MEKVVFVLLYGCLPQLAIARLDLTISSSVCGREYDMEDIGEEAYVVYKGEWLDNKDCDVEFVNYQVYQKQTCIKPINFEISCSTEVEYWRGFISEYLDPERRFSCGNPSFDEWCGPMRTTRFNLLFRTSSRNADDYIKMHLYLQGYPGDKDDSESDDSKPFIPGILLGVFSFVVMIVVIVVVICCLRSRRNQSLPRTPYVCQTVNAPMNLQTGQGNVPISGYQPPQQPYVQPAIQGNYQLHPMQSGYPMPPQQGIAQTEFERQTPSGPQNFSSEGPPSYESLAK